LVADFLAGIDDGFKQVIGDELTARRRQIRTDGIALSCFFDVGGVAFCFIHGNR